MTEITIINLVLSVVITILSIWAFFKRRSDVAISKRGGDESSAPSKAIAIPGVSLFIGISFGLFAISHALTLAGLTQTLQAFIISIRTIAYLLVIVAPARILLKK